MSIGSTIRNMRESRRLTQAELAKIVGTTMQTISAWELDKKIPRMGMLKKLADYFGVQITTIIAGVDMPETIASYLFSTLTPEEQKLAIDHMHFLYAQRQQSNKK